MNASWAPAQTATVFGGTGFLGRRRRCWLAFCLHSQPGRGGSGGITAFAAATLIRPAVMFGPDDAFVAPLLSMLRRLPAFPLFGNGGTRLQPVYVEDIGEAVA